jgi:uncharacterized membrane protein
LPPALTALLSLAPTFALPERYHLLPAFVADSLVGVVVVVAAVLFFLERTRRDSVEVRVVATLVVINTVLTLLAFANLLNVVFTVGPSLRGPALLGSASCFWIAMVATFGLIYWYLDTVAPITVSKPQLLFPELGLDDRSGWRPTFADYAYVSVTTALAFGPSDTAPASGPMRLAMASEALASFVTIGLVFARAFNAIG